MFLLPVQLGLVVRNTPGHSGSGSMIDFTSLWRNYNFISRKVQLNYSAWTKGKVLKLPLTHTLCLHAHSYIFTSCSPHTEVMDLLSASWCRWNTTWKMHARHLGARLPPPEGTTLILCRSDWIVVPVSEVVDLSLCRVWSEGRPVATVLKQVELWWALVQREGYSLVSK